MDAERKELLLTYCHLDDLSPAQDKLLERYFLQATGYLRGAGVAKPAPAADAERAAMYDSCVDALVLDAWDNRRTTVNAALLDNPEFQWMKNQLKMTEPPAAE